MTKPHLSLSLFIIVLSLFFRLWQLDLMSIHMDEVTWMVHSKELIYSTFRRDASFFREKAWWNWRTENYAIGLPANFLSGLTHVLLGGSSRYSLKFFPDIVAARLPIALLSALLPLLVYRFLFMVGQPTVGLLAALGLAVSPLMLTSDRWFLNDSFLALFSFLSLSSFYLASARRRITIWPGIWLALAFLTKPHGILIFIGWIGCLFIPLRFKTSLRLFLVNLLVFYLVTLILWPTAWLNPFFAIPEYLWRQLHLAQVPVSSLFLGRVMDDPGHLYYPFHLLFRNPEIVVIGFFCALVLFFFLPERSKKIRLSLPFLLYCLVFYLLLTFSGTKAGPRYLLPLIPWFYILSAFGLIWLYTRLKNSFLRLGLVILGTVSLFSFLLYFPDNQIYFNQFIGGPKGVVGFARLDVCLGGRAALRELDQQGFAGSYYLYGCTDNGPYYSGREQTKNLKEAKYVIVETWLWELHPYDEVMTYVNTHYKLISTIIQYGVVTARIYAR